MNPAADAHAPRATRSLPAARLALPLLLGLLLSWQPLFGQANPGAGVNRQATWPAPSAEDWQRPCLIPWQRTMEDARAVSEATGKPILVCVNMDGEIASEHYAGILYRRPEIAAIFARYVPVIASVYRHTPRDHDEAGRRIECPRFGRVTCSEHIAIEPGLYEQFFEGRRIAPRHIELGLDGKEAYDVYYAWDVGSVVDTIRAGADEIAPRPSDPRGEGSILERVASPDAADRQAVEAAYSNGDHSLRHSLLAAAIQAGPKAPVELLRLALHGFDAELADLARQALARSESEQAVDLIAETLPHTTEAEQRAALVSALVHLGDHSPRARLLAAVHRGLSKGSPSLDPDAWAQALPQTNAPLEQGEGTTADAYQANPRGLLDLLLEQQDQILHSTDAQAHLALAESFLARARELFAARDEESGRYLFMDARNTARKAARLGAHGARLDTILAVADWYLGDQEQALTRAAAVIAAGLPDDASSWNTMVVLSLFARSRQQAITEAVKAGADWPAAWLADVHDACTLLLRHPQGTVEQAIDHHDFLAWLGADGQAAATLELALARFPGAKGLHRRLRNAVLDHSGMDALLPEYERRLAAGDLPPVWEWYASRAATLSAEYHRRAGDSEQALADYEAARHHALSYGRELPAEADLAEASVALNLAAEARMAYEAGNDDRATSRLLACFAISPDSAADRDGFNLSPVDTALMLRQRLVENGLTEQVQQLDRCMASLDPALLQLPAFERELPDPGSDDKRNGKAPR